MTDFAGLFRRPRDDDNEIVSAMVENVNVNGTVDLSMRGGIVTNVPVLAWYTPATGDIVQAARRSPGQYLVLGSTRKTNPTSVTLIAGFGIPWIVDPVPRTPDSGDNGGSTTLANPFIVTALATGAWRHADGWHGHSASPRQGAFTPAHGWFSGLWFYGTKPQAAAGRTVTRLRIEIRREAGGSSGVEPLYIYPHVHAGQPRNPPYLRRETYGVRGPHRVAGLAVGDTATFDLPKEWGQALVDGYVKGFGVRRNEQSAYAVLSTPQQYARTGRLIINWS